VATFCNNIGNMMAFFSCFFFYDIGKWVLWNVTHIGVRGVVQPMEELDSPPSWVLYGINSGNLNPLNKCNC